MKLELKHVNRVKRRLKDGTVKIHLYHRQTGKKIQGETALALLASHAEAGRPQEAKTASFADLVRSYQRSQNFKQLAASTQRNYRYHLGVALEKWGEFPITQFEDIRTKGEILEWRDTFAEISASVADGLMRALKVVLAFASDRGMIATNPIRGVKKLYSVDRSGLIWKPEQVAKLIEHGSPEIGYAIRLALLTGQRQIDLIKWGWADYRDGGLFLHAQQKTDEPVSLPAQGALGVFLDSLPRSATTILTGPNGKPWDARTFRAHFERAKKRAGFGALDLHFHDLRGTAITTLADHGATPIQIAAFTGHSVTSVTEILRKYLKRTTAQASASMDRLNQSWIGSI